MKFQSEKCGYCGTCICICPNNSLELRENLLIVNESKCDDCGKCALICPLGAFSGAEI
jgi:ferredoxin